MAHQSVLAKKRRGPPPTGKGEQVVVRLQPDLLRPLDQWIKDQGTDAPTRAAAVRLALRSWLTSRGLIPFSEGHEREH